MNPCGHKTKHTARIGCCGGCGELFSSDSAFDRHRRKNQCAKPWDVGLVAVPSKTAPGEWVWTMPGHHWAEGAKSTMETPTPRGEATTPTLIRSSVSGETVK